MAWGYGNDRMCAGLRACPGKPPMLQKSGFRQLVFRLNLKGKMENSPWPYKSALINEMEATAFLISAHLQGEDKTVLQVPSRKKNEGGISAALVLN